MVLHLSPDWTTEGLIDSPVLELLSRHCFLFTYLGGFKPETMLNRVSTGSGARQDQRLWNIYSFPSCVSINEMDSLNGEKSRPSWLKPQLAAKPLGSFQELVFKERPIYRANSNC